jgi:hypothetical protein
MLAHGVSLLEPFVGLCWRWSFWRHAPVVIVQADNVVLAEVITVLDLNEHERDAAGVLNPVSRASRHIDGISAPHVDAVAVKGDNALSANHEPMLGAARMLLVAQPLPRLDLKRLDFEILGLGEDGVSAPRAVGMLDHPAILPDVKQVSRYHDESRSLRPSSVTRRSRHCRAGSGVWQVKL